MGVLLLLLLLPMPPLLLPPLSLKWHLSNDGGGDDGDGDGGDVCAVGAVYN